MGGQAVYIYLMYQETIQGSILLTFTAFQPALLALPTIVCQSAWSSLASNNWNIFPGSECLCLYKDLR